MKKENLKGWLANRKRLYSEGVEMFLKLASPEIKKKYAGYFQEIAEQPNQFDPHFTILINKLTAISLRWNATKGVIAGSSAISTVEVKRRVLGEAVKIFASPDDDQRLLLEIQTKQKELDDLKSQLETEQESGEVKDYQIEELESEIEEKESEIEDLKEKIETIRKGVKIVKENDLPAELLALYRRVQEITPLYAALKTEIADEKISNEDRKVKAEELCKLDDERRAIWNKLDSWAAGEEVRLEIKGVDPDEDLSDDPFTRGLQIANAIKRVKENLARSKGSVTRFTKSGDLNKAAKAQRRVEHYQAEVERLEDLSRV